jgi:hypothetical protein
MTIIGDNKTTYPRAGASVRFVIPGEPVAIPVEVQSIDVDVDVDADSALGIGTVVGKVLLDGRYGADEEDEEEAPFYREGDTITFYVTSGDEWFPL